MKYGLGTMSIDTIMKQNNYVRDNITYLADLIKVESDINELDSMSDALVSYSDTLNNLCLIHKQYSDVKLENDVKVCNEIDMQIITVLSNVGGSLYSSRFNKSSCFKSKTEEDIFKKDVRAKMEGLVEIIAGIWNFIIGIITGILKVIGGIFKGIASIFTGGSSSSSGSSGGSGGGGSRGGSSTPSKGRNIQDILKHYSMFVDKWNRCIEKRNYYQEQKEENLNEEKITKLLVRCLRLHISLISENAIGKDFVDIFSKKENIDSKRKKLYENFLKLFMKDPGHAMRDLEYFRNKGDDFEPTRNDFERLGNIVDGMLEVDFRDCEDILDQLYNNDNAKQSNEKLVQELTEAFEELNNYMEEHEILFRILACDHIVNSVEAIDDALKTIGRSVIDKLEDFLENEIGDMRVPDKDFRDEVKKYFDLVRLSHGKGLYGQLDGVYYTLERYGVERQIDKEFKVKGNVVFFTASGKLMIEESKSVIKNISNKKLGNIIDNVSSFIEERDRFLKLTETVGSDLSLTVSNFKDDIMDLKRDIDLKVKEIDNKVGQNEVSSYLVGVSQVVAEISRFFGQAGKDASRMCRYLAYSQEYCGSFLRKVYKINDVLENNNRDKDDCDNIDLENYKKEIRRSF